MESAFLVPLLSCLVLVSITAASSATVLDTSGNPVLRGAQYYVLAPQVRGLGNLGLATSGACPLNLFLKPYPYGPAAMFFPERSQGNSSVVDVGEDLSAMFAAPTKCPDSTQWRVNGKTGVVTTGGSLPTTASGTSYSRFRIARYEFPNRNFYQLLSCPGVGAGAACATLGVTTEQLLRRTSEVLVVSFMKVTEGSA